MKKQKNNKVIGKLDNWSLIKQMNTAHEDFGTVAKFINSSTWEVEILLREDKSSRSKK